MTTIPADNKPKRWPKHAVWVGLVIAAGNVPLYFSIIQFSPDLRDVPWINMPLSWLALALATVGTWQVVKQGRGVLKNGLAAGGLLLTLFLVGICSWYVFSYSYSLPESPNATATETVAPDFELPDHKGQPISLSDYRGKKLVLVFYRGNW